MITKKQHEAIAKALKTSSDGAGVKAMRHSPNHSVISYVEGYDDAIETAMLNIAAVLMEDNPRFDCDRFFGAVGFPVGKAGLPYAAHELETPLPTRTRKV